MKRITVLTPWKKTAGHNSMQVAEDYPAEWTEITGQQDLWIASGLTSFVAFGKVADAQATALLADPDYVVLAVVDEPGEGEPEPTPADLDAGQVTTLKAALAAKTHSDVAALVTDATVSPVEIVERLKEAQKRPPWQAGLVVVPEEVYAYQGHLYMVIQGHTTQADWAPNVVPALFKRYHEPTDDPWPWEQPQGAHDAYPMGARVLHNGFVWSSNVAANVWEPGSVGAEALWTNLTPPPPTSAWAVGVAYKINDEVTYQGSTYRCRQAHTSQAGWNPPAVPALWLKL